MTGHRERFRIGAIFAVFLCIGTSFLLFALAYYLSG